MNRLGLAELFRRAIDVLERERATYLVYGGIAAAAWGEPAETKDVDVVVQLDEARAGALLRALRAAGFDVRDQAESLFLIDTWTTASLGGRDLDIALGATELDREALRRAVRLQVFERVVPVCSAEDLILYKLVAHRRKDLAHVEAILRRQRGKLDLAYLRAWVQRIATATGKFEVPATLETMLGELA